MSLNPSSDLELRHRNTGLKGNTSYIYGNYICEIKKYNPFTHISSLGHTHFLLGDHMPFFMEWHYVTHWRFDDNRHMNIVPVHVKCCILLKPVLGDVDGNLHLPVRQWKGHIKPSLQHFQFRHVGLSLGILICLFYTATQALLLLSITNYMWSMIW
jgi:hypothetical protein